MRLRHLIQLPGLVRTPARLESGECDMTQSIEAETRGHVDCFRSSGVGTQVEAGLQRVLVTLPLTGADRSRGFGNKARKA